MILSMPAQAWLFLSTILVGACIGLFFDVLRIFRKTVPHSNIAVQIEDLLFWLTVTIAVFYFMLLRNFGEIRLFSIIGIALGLALYFAILSQWVLKVSVGVINYIKKVILSALMIIFTPFRLFFGWLIRPIISFLKRRRKGLRNVSRYGKLHMKKSARNWFILRKKV